MQETTPQKCSIGHRAPMCWSELTPGTRVEVIVQNTSADKGVVDCVADDGTALWVWLERAGQRTLIHHLDDVALRLA